jgi:hypothetical protein
MQSDSVITTGKPTSKSVGDPVDSYRSMRPIWARAKAILGGQSTAKNYDQVLDLVFYRNLLLPFSPKMSQEQYNFYRAEAELPGLVGQYAKILVGGLLRKDPKWNRPDSVPEDAAQWVNNNFGAEDTSMVSFLSEALFEELTTSRAFIMVEHPFFTDEEWDALDAEAKAVVSPYCVLHKAENVINWRSGMNSLTKKRQTIKFVIRGFVEDFTDNKHHPDMVESVTDYYINEQGYLNIQKYKLRSKTTALVVEAGKVAPPAYDSETASWEADGDVIVPKMQGEPMTFIPVFALNGNLEISDPFLQPLVDREIGLYNKISRRNHLLYGASTYTPVISSNIGDEQFETIISAGLGSWIRLNQGDKAECLATPTGALADMEAAIKATIEEMSRMGIRMLSPEGSSAESGVSLEIRNAAQTAQLGLLNAKVSKTLEQVIAVMFRWKYGIEIKDGELDFELSQDFNPVPIGADWMRLVTEWYEGGKIPRSTWLSIGQANDIIPPDYDDEKGKEEIQNDPIIAMAGAQIDASIIDGLPPEKKVVKP